MLYLTPFSHNTSVTDGQMTTTTKGEPLRLELSDRPDNTIFMVGSTDSRSKNDCKYQVSAMFSAPFTFAQKSAVDTFLALFIRIINVIYLAQYKCILFQH